jgi:hypothetical protein
MNLVRRLLLALGLLAPLAARADIEGFVLRLERTERDEPIESWVVYEGNDEVHYSRCQPSAEECTRESPEQDVAERRKVTKSAWLSEVARTFGLDARVLLNAEASARRIDASIEALKELEADMDTATEREREEAKTKLATLTKKDGYRDRFIQARALAAAIAPPGEGDANLVIESSDRRAYRARWPFNFAADAFESTNAYVRGTDVLTGLVWTALKGKQSTWNDASAHCAAENAGSAPTSEQLTAAAPWLAASPLAAVLREAGKTEQARFWLRGGSSFREDPSDPKAPPTAEGAELKVFHSFGARFDFYRLEASRPEGGQSFFESPAGRAAPSIVHQPASGPYGRAHDVLVDPSEQDLLAFLGQKTSGMGVLCVQRRRER